MANPPHQPTFAGKQIIDEGAVSRRCPLCGEPNRCGLLNPESSGPCWCTQVEIPAELLNRIPKQLQNRACVCNGCIQASIDEMNES